MCQTPSEIKAARLTRSIPTNSSSRRRGGVAYYAMPGCRFYSEHPQKFPLKSSLSPRSEPDNLKISRPGEAKSFCNAIKYYFQKPLAAVLLLIIFYVAQRNPKKQLNYF